MTRTITLELTAIEAASLVGLFNRELESTKSIIKFMDDEDTLHFLERMEIYKGIVDKIKVELKIP